MILNRRRFLGTAAAGAALLSSPMALGQKRPRVVIVGGGAGGATAARYIAKDSKGAIEVILIEPSRTYYTCFFSNLAIGGFQPMSNLAHSYGKLASEYGVTVVHDWASAVDREKRKSASQAAMRFPTTGWFCRRVSTLSKIPLKAGM